MRIYGIENSFCIDAPPTAGDFNPLVKAASLLFSMLGKWQRVPPQDAIHEVQKELLLTLDNFQKKIIRLGYQPEFIIVCRYIFCLTYDDVISNTLWGKQVQWEQNSLLGLLYQETVPGKFFVILKRIIKEPMQYIDLMELMYICLKMGYQGEYRSLPHQLEDLTTILYKHTRSYRGVLQRKLSTKPCKALKSTEEKSISSPNEWLFIFFMTASIIMTLFLSLSYLMDTTSNETYKNITKVRT
jgi:type VI secretion system protein ImpK